MGAKVESFSHLFYTGGQNEADTINTNGSIQNTRATKLTYQRRLQSETDHPPPGSGSHDRTTTVQKGGSVWRSVWGLFQYFLYEVSPYKIITYWNLSCKTFCHRPQTDLKQTPCFGQLLCDLSPFISHTNYTGRSCETFSPGQPCSQDRPQNVKAVFVTTILPRAQSEVYPHFPSCSQNMGRARK